MRIAKTVSAFALVLVMMFSMAACGGGGKGLPEKELIQLLKNGRSDYVDSPAEEITSITVDKREPNPEHPAEEVWFTVVTTDGAVEYTRRFIAGLANPEENDIWYIGQVAPIEEENWEVKLLSGVSEDMVKANIVNGGPVGFVNMSRPGLSFTIDSQETDLAAGTDHVVTSYTVEGDVLVSSGTYEFFYTFDPNRGWVLEEWSQIVPETREPRPELLFELTDEEVIDLLLSEDRVVTLIGPTEYTLTREDLGNIRLDSDATEYSEKHHYLVYYLDLDIVSQDPAPTIKFGVGYSLNADKNGWNLWETRFEQIW